MLDYYGNELLLLNGLVVLWFGSPLYGQTKKDIPRVPLYVLGTTNMLE